MTVTFRLQTVKQILPEPRDKYLENQQKIPIQLPKNQRESQINGLKCPPIQASILNRLRKMGRLNILGTFQVSDGSTHLKDPVVRPGAQAELGDGRFQEPFQADVVD